MVPVIQTSGRDDDDESVKDLGIAKELKKRNMKDKFIEVPQISFQFKEDDGKSHKERL